VGARAGSYPWIGALSLLLACGGPEDPAPADAATDAEGGVNADAGLDADAMIPPITGRFNEVAAEVGLTFEHRAGPLPVALGEDYLMQGTHMSGGAAVADFDADGFVDLYLPSADADDRLYFGSATGRFEDRTSTFALAQPGSSSAAAAADIDGDGDSDIFVTTYLGDRHFVFINRLDETPPRFTEEAEARGLSFAAYAPVLGFGGAFGDYDLDGYLDLFVSDWGPRATGTASAARLMHNLGATSPGVFEDVTIAAGVTMDGFQRRNPVAPWGGWVFTVAFTDLDDDGLPDLVVASDFNTARIFWSRGDGTFEDGTLLAGFDDVGLGMGLALADIDGDGRTDVYFSEVGPVSEALGPDYVLADGLRDHLFLNLGGRRFAEVGMELGVAYGGWAWGTSFLDVERDGSLELFVANGVTFESPVYLDDPSLLWAREGEVYVDRAAEFGLRSRGQGRAALVFDGDADGDQDLLVVNHIGNLEYFRNEIETPHGFLDVRLQGIRANRAGIGAVVSIRIHPGAPLIRQEIVGGAEFCGSVPASAFFGLGPGDAPIDELRVRWPTPDRHEQILRDVPRNARIVIVEE